MKTVISILIFFTFFLIFTKEKPKVKLMEIPQIERFHAGIEILKKRQQIEIVKSEIRLLQSQVEFKIKTKNN